MDIGSMTDGGIALGTRIRESLKRSKKKKKKEDEEDDEDDDISETIVRERTVNRDRPITEGGKALGRKLKEMLKKRRDKKAKLKLKKKE